VSYAPRARKCIYCGERADSLEHVIPRWIPEHFGLEAEVMSHDQAIGITPGQRMLFGDYKARIYCHRCHRRINRLIENTQARELIKRLFPGSAATLDLDEQKLLAAWATKTCYAKWGMARRRRGIPIAHRRHLIETGEPWPSVCVSVSRSTGDRVRVIFARHEITSAVDGSISYAYDFVLAIGQLALEVWGPSSRIRLVEYKQPTSFATRLWPTQTNVARWPPGRHLDDDGVSRLRDYDPRAGKQSRETT